MSILEIFGLVSGLASFLSLILYLNDKYTNWKNFILPICSGLFGFTIGVISCGLVGTSKTTQDPFLLGTLSILIVIFAVCLIAFKSLMKQDNYKAYLVIILPLMIIVPNILNHYFDTAKTNTAIPPSDYLQLAILKEEKNETEAAIKYLKIFEMNADEETVKNKINEKILQLRQAQVNKELNINNK